MSIRKAISILSALAILLTFSAFSAFADQETAASGGKGYEQKETVLTGKRILFTGDSITDAYCERTNARRDIMYGWVSRIGEYNGMKWITTGYGGASVSDCRGENTILRQLRRKQNSSYDIVVLHGGVNDAWDSAPLGKISDSFDPKDFNVSTFAGGLETTIQFAKTCFPDAIIGYIINFKLPLAPYGKISNMNGYVAITKQACDKWGIHYLDLYNNKELNDALEVGTSTKYLPDHIHPNTGGYDIIYPYIETWLMDLVSQAEEPETSAPNGEADFPSEDTAPANGSDPAVSADAPSVPAQPGLSASAIAAIVSACVLAAAVVALVILLRKKKKV